MTRDDLVQTNEEIVYQTSRNIAKYAPQATIIVLTNPVDAMTYTALKASGFLKNVSLANQVFLILHAINVL